MSSSEAISPRPRRLWRWLAAILILLAALYSVGWYFAGRAVSERIDHALADLAKKGVAINCANRAIGGFPLRLGVTCSNIDYQDDQRQIAFAADRLDAGVAAYRPMRVDAQLAPPLRVQSPDFPPLALDWDALSAQVEVARPLPESIALAARNLSAQSDPDNESDPAKLFDAAEMTAKLRPDGKDLVWAGTFAGLAIDPEMVEGRTIPSLDGAGQATIINGVSMLTDRPRSLRGQAIDIAELALSSGEGSLTLTGPASVDTEGYINADLRITLKNPQAIAQALQTAIPERSGEIRTAFMGLSFMGKDPSIPLKIVKGRVTLLGMALTEIEPLTEE